MLGRLAQRCFNGLSRRRFRCRRCSIGLRSVHLAPEEHHISPPAAADPRWVMLSTKIPRKDGSVAHDARTVAESTTSTGRSFRVSADLAAPPATSSLCYDWEGGGHQCSNKLLAAHGDSVLISNLHSLDDDRYFFSVSTANWFVYRAGTAARAPSLSLLPTPTHLRKLWPSLSFLFPTPTDQIHKTTGLLRRSEDELLVVELDLGDESRVTPRRTANLNVLRLGSSEWEKRSAVPIVLGDGRRGGMRRDFFPDDRVVPVGNRFLCWVKYYSSGGILLCDMAADPNLMLRHLPLPVTPWPCGGPHHVRGYNDDKDEDDDLRCYRNMCGAGATALRFVSIDPRSCCGGPGRSTCPRFTFATRTPRTRRSTFAFTVTTWTMRLTTAAEEERMEWTMDGMLDCEELWAMPGYGDCDRTAELNGLIKHNRHHLNTSGALA